MADAAEEFGKAVLRPRRPGETLKVAETVLKRRDRNLQAFAQRATEIAGLRRSQKNAKKGLGLNIARAERLVKNSRTRRADKQRLRQQQKKRQPKSTQKGKVLAVGRNGRPGGSKETKMMFKELGLTKRHTMTFMPNTDEIAKKLFVCKPFLFWGNPSFKTVSKIMHKKMYFRDPDAENNRTVLSDNTLVEKHLGDLGMLCTADLAHAIHTNSPKFPDVMKRLWPIMLDDSKRANGLIREKDYLYGHIAGGIDDQLKKLLGD